LGGLIYVIYIDCKPSGFFWKAMGTCACTVMFTSLLSMTPVFAADVDERLWSAASYSDLDGLKAAIEDGPDVDYANRSNMPTLQVVAMNGNASVVGLLLKRGAIATLSINTVTLL
jgi:hypothetical protein